MARTRFEPRGPWTRAHEKFAKAWGDLGIACARRGAAGPMSLGDWLFARWRVWNIRHLTPAQAKNGARQLNAWRGGVEGWCFSVTAYPRQWKRNRRRADSARNTASMRGPEFENLIRGTALEALGGLVPAESAGRSA